VRFRGGACRPWWSDRPPEATAPQRRCGESYLRDHRGGRCRTRWQESRPVPLQGEDQYAPEIDAFESHRRDVVQDLRVNLAVLHPSAVQGRLHVMRIPGHHQIRDQGERP
jgi:hypothetical protein